MFHFFKKKEKTRLFYHTDVHSHILPGVDHGAQSIEDSLQLIHAEQEMGIDRIFFTPHVTQTTFENDSATINAAYNTFLNEIKTKDIEMSFACSAEYRIDDLFMKQFSENDIIPLPKNHLLVENAFTQEFLGLDNLLFDIQLKGFSPIMAHPERYRYYDFQHDRLRKLHDSGILFQANLLSFTGYFGKAARQAALWLLQNDYIDFLGSDIHNTIHADTISKYIQTKEFSKIAAKLENRLMNDQI